MQDPAELARRFVAAGCRRLHVVDLAGARAGRPMQLGLLSEIVVAARADAPGVLVEAGGGLRRPADVAALLEIADDALLGTAAIEDPEFLRDCRIGPPRPDRRQPRRARRPAGARRLAANRRCGCRRRSRDGCSTTEPRA